MCPHPNPPPNPSPERFRPAADNAAPHVDKFSSLAATSTSLVRAIVVDGCGVGRLERIFAN